MRKARRGAAPGPSGMTSEHSFSNVGGDLDAVTQVGKSCGKRRDSASSFGSVQIGPGHCFGETTRWHS